MLIVRGRFTSRNLRYLPILTIRFLQPTLITLLRLPALNVVHKVVSNLERNKTSLHIDLVESFRR